MAANLFEKLSEMFSSLKADDGDDEEEEEEEEVNIYLMLRCGDVLLMIKFSHPNMVVVSFCSFDMGYRFMELDAYI